MTTAADTVLVVEDEAPMRRFLSAALQSNGFRVVEASTLANAQRLATEQHPDAILLDLGLPDGDGLSLVHDLRTWSAAPVIVLSARDREDDKVAALDAGADDYLTKPINFPELEARVRSMLRIKKLQDLLEEKMRELERLSISDGLTGLFNHRHIHGLLAEEFERADRIGDDLTVAMFDLDRFKSVNDTYGHQAGDRVLQQFADLLRHQARDIDRIGRYGGEEFMVILPSTSLREGTIFVERVRKDAEGHGFAIGRDEPISMTVSAGVATYPHEMVGSPETLVRLADEALYAAKEGGRNRVVRFDEMELEPAPSEQPG